MKRIHTLVAAAVLAGCSSVSEPSIDARLEVTQSVITADRVTSSSATTVRFTLPYRVENVGSESLLFHECPSGRVEVLDEDGWRTAWGGYQICIAIYAPVTIPRGESRELQLRIIAPMNGRSADWLHDRIDGTYRYTMTVFTASTGDRIPRAVSSNGFELREAR